MKYLILLWLSGFIFSDCTVTHAVTVAEKIIKAQNPRRFHDELMAHLKTTSIDQLNRNKDLICILKALLILPTLLTPFKTALQQSTPLFNDTPGYADNLRLIVAKSQNRGLVNGHAYEIERALKLAQTGIAVLGFNVMLSSKSLARQFDILTSEYAIECKNIRWKPTLNKELQRQFLAQKNIIAHHNNLHNRTRQFQVSSRQPVPERWREWFKTNNIALHEEAS